MKTRGQEGYCRQSNVGYEIGCEECAASEESRLVMYIGETNKNVFLRGGEHLNDYRYGNKKPPIFKHATVHHQGRLDVQFNMKVKSRFRDALHTKSI